MTCANKNILFAQALSKFGASSQVDMCIEECAELITALQHYKRHRVTRANVAEELADVSIMLAQMKIVFGQELVAMAEDLKLNRLERRVRAVA